MKETASVETSIAGSSSRLNEFEGDIRGLGVKGGNARPERWMVVAGLLATVVGLVLVVVGLVGVRRSDSGLAQGDNLAMMWLGLGVAIVGVVLWARYSFSRYLRYWLVRQVFEQRANTDRIVEAIEQQGRS